MAGLSIKDCLCEQSSFGVNGCDIKLQSYIKLGIQKITANDGTRNGIPKTATINSVFVQDLINETDSSKKLTIIEGMDIITLLEKEIRTTGTDAGFDKKNENQGIYEVIGKFQNLSDNKLKLVRNICNGYGLYLFGTSTDYDEIARALDIGDANIYPMPIEDDTSKVARNTAKTKSTSSEEELMFQLRQTVTSNNTNYIVMESGTLDALVESREITLEQVSITNTEIVVEAVFKEAPSNKRIPYDVTTASLYALTDTTTNTEITPTSITLNALEQLVFTVPATVAGNTYSLGLVASGISSKGLTGTFVA